jgi:hypothetical protein
VPSPVLDSPGTSVVLGGRAVDTGWRSGGEFAFGYWFDSPHRTGVEISYFFLPNHSKNHSVHSNGSPNSAFLLVPFYNVNTGAEDSTAIASPLLQFQGTAKLKVVNQMQGAELNVLSTLPSTYCRSRFIGSAGFRYWNFREQLTFATNSPFIPSHAVDTYATKDTFKTDNNFYGGQLDLEWEYTRGSLSVTTTGKVALGAMCESLRIHGQLRTNDYNGFGTILNYPGGYFALPTNIGKYRQTKLAAIPEFHCGIRYQLFKWMRIETGYTFMYVTNVLWAGKQINRNINPSQATSYTNAIPAMLVGQASPTARLKTDSLWVQGLNVGVECSF